MPIRIPSSEPEPDGGISPSVMNALWGLLFGVPGVWCTMTGACFTGFSSLSGWGSDWSQPAASINANIKNGAGRTIFPCFARGRGLLGGVVNIILFSEKAPLGANFYLLAYPQIPAAQHITELSVNKEFVYHIDHTKPRGCNQ
jgi:hypothetical protein